MTTAAPEPAIAETAQTTATTPITAPAAPSEVELTIGGMTCASCAARVEKKLNRMDGVTATVNFATEKAKVSYPVGVQVADLIATVVKTGYTAEEPRRRASKRRNGPPTPSAPTRTPSSPPCANGSSCRPCSPFPSS